MVRFERKIIVIINGATSHSIKFLSTKQDIIKINTLHSILQHQTIAVYFFLMRSEET